jgi:hypothetical protein
VACFVQADFHQFLQAHENKPLITYNPEYKGVIRSNFGYSPCFTGVLASQSATEWRRFATD